jgi:hypothetical protein
MRNSNSQQKLADMGTDECLSKNYGWWRDDKTNITACKVSTQKFMRNCCLASWSHGTRICAVIFDKAPSGRCLNVWNMCELTWVPKIGSFLVRLFKCLNLDHQHVWAELTGIPLIAWFSLGLSWETWQIEPEILVFDEYHKCTCFCATSSNIFQNIQLFSYVCRKFRKCFQRHI